MHQLEFMTMDELRKQAVGSLSCMGTKFYVQSLQAAVVQFRLQTANANIWSRQRRYRGPKSMHGIGSPTCDFHIHILICKTIKSTLRP